LKNEPRIEPENSQPISDSNLETPDRYKFGLFEVQIRAGILLLEGERIRIQELPFQMLLVLLETHGQLVTHEELRRRLWSNKKFVDFESGLRVALKKLRAALGDDATEPRFIRTVSGRGYKFIAEVTTAIDISLLPLTVSNVPDSGIQEEKHRARYRIPAFVTSLVVLSTVITGALAFYIRRPLLGAQDRVIIGGFTNDSGKPEVNGILSTAFRLKLQESPYLTIIPAPSLHSLMGDSDRASLKDQLSACASLEAQVLLNGRITTLPKGFQIFLTAWRCKDGKLLVTQKTKADSETNLLSAVDVGTERMRRALGESAQSLQAFNVPSMQATTASLSALKAFTSGEEKRVRGREDDSILDYKLAVDLDPQFALAYARLGTLYFNAEEYALSRQNYQKAFELRNRNTDRDRLDIITHYYAHCTGEIRRAIEAYELWRKVYPRDMTPANNLAIEYLLIGEPEKAVNPALIAVQLDPVARQPYATLTQAYSMSGDYVHLNHICKNPAHGPSDSIVFHLYCFRGAFAQDDEAGMQQELRWAHGNPRESAMLNESALVAMCKGKIKEAQRLFAEAEQSAIKNNLAESAANMRLNQAAFEAELGLQRDAKEHALEALNIAPDSSIIHALAALALARAGDIARARSEADKVGTQLPLNTVLNSAVLPSVRAAIQLQKGESEAAIRSLDEARPLDLNYILGVATAYYRGLAFLQNNQPHEALKEFQRIVDRRAIDPDSPFIVLSQLELGRTFQLVGDRANADRVLGDVRNTWKDADHNFPPLRQIQIH
jgi:eukaryotic-like serine/threonine-protein kinase